METGARLRYVDAAAARFGGRGAFLKPFRRLLTGRPKGPDVRAQLALASVAAEGGAPLARDAGARLDVLGVNFVV